MRNGTAEATRDHYLIVGPWDHPGTRTPKAEVGGLKFGAASVLDLNDLHRQWYDWTMKGGAKPDFLKQRVAYYVVGDEAWKYADTLEGVSGRRKTLYLSSRDGAADLYHSGSLEEKPTATGADRWSYDPLDTRAGDAEPAEDPSYLTSQREVLNLYGSGAVYHGEPLPEPTELSGF